MVPCSTQGPVLLCLLLCGSIGCATSILSEQQHVTVHDEQLSPNTDINEDTFLTFLAPISSRVTNQKCRNESLLYIQHLRNFTLWATKMFDASAKLPVGLLAGSTYQMGHFDECLQVGYEESPTEVVPLPAPVRGQYCLARLQLAPHQQTYPGFTRKDVPHAFSLQYDPNLSAWEKFMIPQDPSKKRRDVFHTAVCVPASCEPRDLEISMRDALESVQARLGVRIDLSVDEKMCQTNESRPLSGGDIAFIVICVVSLLAVLSCTAYDMIIARSRPQVGTTQFTLGQQILLSFSAYSNLEKLNKPDSTKEFGILHGIRLYSMVFIILGHRCMSSFGGPFFNPEAVEERYRNVNDMFFLNGTILVDTFFVLSGFLTCFGILHEVKKNKTINIGLLYLYRWLRLTPVYMIIVAFYATLLHKVGTGPLWNLRVGVEKQRCLDNWWTNLLYVNNYVNSDRLCMFQSWFIACDMHYFLIAPLLVLPLHRRPPLGMALLGVVILLTIIVPFTITYVGEYNGILRVYMSLLEDPIPKEDYYAIYIKSHNRAAPYFIGIAAAYLYSWIKLKQIKIRMHWMIIFSIVAFSVGLSSLVGAWVFYIPGREYYDFENAAYASLHRVGWALGISWLIIGGCTTRFGILQPILHLHAYLPLSRLTYSVFLSHGIVQLYSLGTLRQPEFLNLSKLLWMATGDITMSFILALFIYLLFEAPLGGIQKIFLRRLMKTSGKHGNGDVILQSANRQTSQAPVTGA